MHICGKCHEEFASDDGYLEHKCESTGHTPVEPEHQGPEFLAVQAAALERGKDRVPDGSTAEAKQDAAIAEVQEKIDALPQETRDAIYGVDSSDDTAQTLDESYHAG